jgi:putative transposase
VALFEKQDVSLTRACELLGISRRRCKYRSRRDDSELVDQMKELARQHPRWGVRQIWRSLRRAGRVVNLKRVRRLSRKHGLLLRPRRRRKRLGIGVGLPCRAEYPNHVWAYDFVEDRTETGQKLRILTIVDEFTRRCIEVEVESRMNARFVARTLLRLVMVHGVPKFIRSDNGSEFTARYLMNVLKIHGIEARHIDPGSPWQNGIDERFNGTLREECLNLETFHGRDHARAIVKLFAKMYNTERQHGSLGKAITPEEFYAKWKRENEDRMDGCADGGVKGLSHCTPPAGGNENGLIERLDQPISRKAIHDGDPVAPQQSRILRVDESSVPETNEAGMFPAGNQQLGPKT